MPRIDAQMEKVGAWLADLALPRRCGGCGITVAGRGICHRCWREITFLGPPSCAVCGLPFEVDPGEDGAICGACTAHPPVTSLTRSAIAYDDGSRSLILSFKHGDRLDAVPLLVDWLTQAALPIADGVDTIAPVPLHWRRLFKRRYNQSAELARGLAQRLQVPCVPDLLSRTRSTPSQGSLTPRQRHRNVRGAFAVTPQRSAADRVVLLVDDVYTTGATLEACAKTLLHAGATEVRAVTVARVISPKSMG